MVQVQHGQRHAPVGQQDQARDVEIGGGERVRVTEQVVVVAGSVLQLGETVLGCRQRIVHVQMCQVRVQGGETVGSREGFQHLQLTEPLLLGVFHLEEIVLGSPPPSVSLDQLHNAVEMPIGC